MTSKVRSSFEYYEKVEKLYSEILLLFSKYFYTRKHLDLVDNRILNNLRHTVKIGSWEDVLILCERLPGFLSQLKANKNTFVDNKAEELEYSIVVDSIAKLSEDIIAVTDQLSLFSKNFFQIRDLIIDRIYHKLTLWPEGLESLKNIPAPTSVNEIRLMLLKELDCHKTATSITHEDIDELSSMLERVIPHTSGSILSNNEIEEAKRGITSLREELMTLEVSDILNGKTAILA